MQVLRRRRRTAESGYTLVDQLMTIALIGTVSAIAVPALTNAVEGQRLGIDTRNVERELQIARLGAVTADRPIRVRFDCPSAGGYRRVELLGSISDESSGDDADNQGARRCDLTLYPYPAASPDPLVRPKNDGPLRRLNSSVAFTSTQTLEFWPNGTVHVAIGAAPGQPWPQLGATPATLTLTKGTTTKNIVVNSLGKIQIQ